MTATGSLTLIAAGVLLAVYGSVPQAVPLSETYSHSQPYHL